MHFKYIQFAYVTDKIKKWIILVEKIDFGEWLFFTF